MRAAERILDLTRGLTADDLVLLRFADYGSEAYGYAVIVNPAFAVARPTIPPPMMATRLEVPICMKCLSVYLWARLRRGRGIEVRHRLAPDPPAEHRELRSDIGQDRGCDPVRAHAATLSVIHP